MRPRVPHDDPGTPDARGPGRYLWWLIRCQLGRACLGAVWASLGMVALMLPPYLLARAIDDGLRPGDMAALGLWSSAILTAGALGAVLGMLRHRTMTFVRLDGAYRTIEVVLRQVVRLGSALPRRASTGEVVNVGASDIDRIARTLTIAGPGVGSFIAYAVVAVLLLSVHPLLAAVVLLGVPALAIVLRPLLGRLQRHATRYREQQGALAARAGDIVGGLRVLRGIGGTELFADRYRSSSQQLRSSGYHVGRFTSWLQALPVGFPTVFLAAVTWLAARMVAGGEITVGDLVAVYGYVAVLAIPVANVIEGAEDLGHGLVAAGRVVRILNLTPDVDGGEARGPAAPADLHDPASGLVVPAGSAGSLLAIASARPADATALVDRLGRYVESDVRWGPVALSDVPLPEVRRRILVGDNDAYLFAGTVRDALATHEDHSDAAIAAAVHTAAAEDILDMLVDGLGSAVEAQGRNLSGGQQQRLRLVRALLADPEVLILVEPTSAVDAHTEARIAERLCAARAGRTTVVATTSPLLLGRAERVAYVVDGTVAASGTHDRLLATEPGYGALVLRGAEEGHKLPTPPGRAS